MQGRPKGGKNKKYSKEEKIMYVQQLLDGKSCRDIEREYGIGHAVVHKWLQNYLSSGENGLDYNKRKKVSINGLKRENMYLRIENERLKRGYFIDGMSDASAFRERELEIIHVLSNDYYVTSLCDAMYISKEVYYEWLSSRE